MTRLMVARRCTTRPSPPPRCLPKRIFVTMRLCSSAAWMDSSPPYPRNESCTAAPASRLLIAIENPTEYLKEAILPRYIRNPKAIRSWEGSKMPGFGPETFSDEDIASIVAYLKEMASEKPHTDGGSGGR